jgi:hypothetical protein
MTKIGVGIDGTSDERTLWADDEIAQRAVTLFRSFNDGCAGGEIETITHALMEAVAVEREACARIAEEWAELLAPADPSRAGAAAQVAVEIRKRTERTECP